MKSLLSRREASDYLGVSLVTLDKFIKDGVNPIPSVKIGKRVVIPSDGLMEWVSCNMQSHSKTQQRVELGFTIDGYMERDFYNAIRDAIRCECAGHYTEKGCKSKDGARCPLKKYGKSCGDPFDTNNNEFLLKRFMEMFQGG